ncbi:hypothetical protein B0I37DRAFT_384086 [Chaetomium sp. MPI-CAGE-AT-0009]|nr:hypothetical protein B0I37DRAFT_384086 [Chaetomium sp. MPI-CAGE-AT-0009]
MWRVILFEVFGPAQFRDPRLQDLWTRISGQGERLLLRKATDEAARVNMIAVIAPTQGVYNVAPQDLMLFYPEARRIYLYGGWWWVFQGM